jgi:uncharacterized membrane protein
MTRAALAVPALLLMALSCLATASPARAGLKLCNKTSYILYAATGMSAADGVSTKGWTRVVPGACALAMPGNLGTAPAYIFARTSQAYSGPAHTWGGNTKLCVANDDFSLDVPLTATRCPADESFDAPFSQVASNGAAAWTTTFTQTPALASLDAARQAGLARLLADNGYKAAKPGSKEMTAELDKFRARMRMSGTADSSALFDALETEALKTAAPAGYSVCNDTDQAVWAALGEHAGKTWRSRGWWKVTPGTCARAITTPLTSEKVYLLVEGKGTNLIVTGKEKFCVTSIIFDVERRGNCKDRGLVERGFATTNTAGRAGFTAHVSEKGLLPSLHGPD